MGKGSQADLNFCRKGGITGLHLVQSHLGDT